MFQSTFDRLHVGIIMDGNGRWARRRGLPRPAGHRAGAPAVRRIVSAAPRHGIGVLTLYAFSSDNWKRPPLEVAHLMKLLRSHLRTEADRCVDEGVRLSVIGRRDRLPEPLVKRIRDVERRTLRGHALHLRIAIDYSSRDAILRTVRRLLERGGPAPTREEFGRLLADDAHTDHELPRTPSPDLPAPRLDSPTRDVDLVIRTGGEKRLSDFLLWECAYAELVFTPCLWPDFDEPQLAAAIERFRARERRFGALPLERTLTAAKD